MELKAYLRERASEVDAAMDAFLPKAKARPATIHSAMRYSVFAGGKRLRPVLCLAAAEACGGDVSDALAPACAKITPQKVAAIRGTDANSRVLISCLRKPELPGARFDQCSPERLYRAVLLEEELVM